MSRYEVVYFGAFFCHDKENEYNSYLARDWNDAYSFFMMIKDDFPGLYLKDNEYDVYFDGEDWR
jgi:hypothetical protein